MTTNKLREAAMAVGCAVMMLGIASAAEEAPLVPKVDPNAPAEVNLEATANQAATQSESAAAEMQETSKASPVKYFSDREVAHESIFKLIDMRRTQARENPETFWQNYEFPGPEELLEKTVTLNAEDALLADVFGNLSTLTGAQFEFMPGLEKRRVSIDVTDNSLRQVLTSISQVSDIVPVHDQFASSFIIVNLRDPEVVTELESYRIPLRHFDPAKFLEFCKQLGYEPAEGAFVPEGEERAFLYTGSRKDLNPMRSFMRDFDRRPPPSDEEYHLEVIAFEHQDPSGIILELRRQFHGNFATRGNKLGVVVIPSQLETLKAFVAEYDQPPPATE